MAGLLVAFAGIIGALGVALSAIAAHRNGADNLATAAQFLLFHAPAFLALAALMRLRIVPRIAGLFVALCLALGLMAFAGDLAHRVFLGDRLFLMAAPIGGSLMIFGWVFLGLAGLYATYRSLNLSDEP